MAEQTTNLNLKKPEYGESADVKDFNDNMDIIDTAIGQAQTDIQNRINKPVGVAEGKFLQTDANGDAVWGNAADQATIISTTEGWLENHINTNEFGVDDTLLIAGDAADSKVVGDNIADLKSAIKTKDDADSFVFSGENAIDFDNITTGKRIIVSSGNLSDNASYFVTDYIPVRPGMIFRKNHVFDSSSYGTAFYDESKTFVSGSGKGGTTSQIIVPDGSSYVRTSFKNTDTDAAVYITYAGMDDISSLKETAKYIREEIKLEFEQGTINTSGVAQSSETRIRTGFYEVTRVPLYIHVKEGFKAGYRIYSSNEAASFIEYGGFYTEDTFIPVKVGQYIRLLLAKTDDSNIQKSEIFGYNPLAITSLDINTGEPFSVPNAEAVAYGINSLNYLIDQISGVKHYLWKIGYIPTSASYVDKDDIRLSSEWRHCIVPCSEGDSFFINAVYCSTSKRPYSFIANDGTVLEQRQKNSAQNLTITAPAGTAFLVCNSGPNQNDEWTCELHTPNSDINSEGDQDILNKVQQLARARRVNKVMQTPPLVLLHFSDIHADVINLNRIMKFYGGHSKYIHDVIHAGDSVDDEFSDGFSFWGTVEGTENVLNIIGNHDSNVKEGGNNNWYAKTETECYETYIEPYVSNWGVTSTENHCYYYKDYPTNNVRLICLDAMHMTDDQLSWFTDALAGAKTAGYHVIVASHMMGHWPHTPYNTTFNDTFLTREAQPSFNPNYREYMLAGYSDAVQDFIDGGGNFCCWIGGHTHYDVFSKLDRHPDQLQINVGLAGIANANNSAAMRVRGTKSEDLFNVLAVDTYSKIVKIVRVGEDYNLMMQHKNTVCYNYDTHELIV